MGNSIETQDKILETAIRHFAKNGYHGTKTADIARNSGVSEGTIFKYFSTKKDILRSVMNKIVKEIIPGIAFGDYEDFQSLECSSDPGKEMKRFFKVRIEKINENIDAFKVFINELQYHEDIMNEYAEQFVPKMLGMLEGFFASGISRGIFRNIDPHTAARSMVGMVVTIILERNALRKPIVLDKELDTALDIFLNGIYVRR